jgi:hypothetical protein
MRLLLAFSLACALGLACSAPGSRTTQGVPLTGHWGGEHIALTLTEAGGEIEYDCARGGISGPLRTDDAGRVDAIGVHVRGHGGPAREGERPDSVPARYLGRVRGDRLTLRVVAATDTLGPFELRRDAEPRIFRCL